MQSNPLQKRKTVKKPAAEIPLHLSHSISPIKINCLEQVQECYSNLPPEWITLTVSEIIHTEEGQRQEGDHLFPLFCCPLLSTFGWIAESTVSSHLPNSCKKPESELVASTNAKEPARDTTRFFHMAFFPPKYHTETEVIIIHFFFQLILTSDTLQRQEAEFKKKKQLKW